MSNMFPENARNEQVKENEAENFDAASESISSKVYASKKLARFFELEVNLRVFGQLVWSWTFPPKSNV